MEQPMRLALVTPGGGLRLGEACTLDDAHELCAWYWFVGDHDWRVAQVTHRTVTRNHPELGRIKQPRAVYTDVLTGEVLREGWL